MISKEKIIEVLEQFIASEKISGVVVNDGKVGFALESQDEALREKAERAVFSLPGVEKVTAVLTGSEGKIIVESKNTPVLDRRQPVPGAKKVIAVAAGKGGVGKSTIAVNLAVAANKLGIKTGLVDADIYGPSVPKMLGMSSVGKPDMLANLMLPHETFGMQTNSIGYLIDESEAAIWRGPMATKAIHSLLLGTKWDVDVLFIDMPPGTGDIQLSIAQNYKVDGVIIVSTPQEIALADVRKAVKMFQRVNIPVLGVIENMAYFIDPVSGNKNHIFGEGGARDYAEEINAPFLAEVPLDIELRQNADSGKLESREVFEEMIQKIID